MKNDLQCFWNDNLYIYVTGFHAYEKEGMGLWRFGKILLLFQKQNKEMFFLEALYLFIFFFIIIFFFFFFYDNWETLWAP